MGTLMFKVDDDLKKIVEHTRKHGECNIAYTHEVGEPSLYLVKDSGAYLMSASKKRLPANNGDPKDTSSLVVYAKGMNPNVDEGYYETTRAACGGDDFAENLDLKFFENAITKGHKFVVIALLKTKIKMKATNR